MNKKQYQTMRKALMDEAQKLLNEGNAEGAEAKMNEVKELDEKWDTIAQAQANFTALNQEPAAVNIFGTEGSIANFSGEVQTEENIYDTVEYRNAFMELRTRWKIDSGKIQK